MKKLLFASLMFFALCSSGFGFQTCLVGLNQTMSLDKTSVQPGDSITLKTHIATTTQWSGGYFQITQTLFNDPSGAIPVDNRRETFYLPAGIQSMDIPRVYVVPCFYGNTLYDWYWHSSVRNIVVPSEVCQTSELDFSSSGAPLCN
jgi:hypothetical protein